MIAKMRENLKNPKIDQNELFARIGTLQWVLEEEGQSIEGT